ncbi:protein FAR1-RELATED SEQUENCE 5-like [Salvia splendens]|uniref:protein FAR1-RELATED SEQUENCE 5-like n=1 Tax=Salvia splendens TaxID=180675 RepID=UPI001C261A1B|nr:protein FAR1-RELATED SEQUENCE 5-like [Salvia splendens]
MEEVRVVPACSEELKPVVGLKFQSLDFALTFYDVYARAVGFDTHKQGVRKVEDVTTWYYVVCNRECHKKSNEDDQLNAHSGFLMKLRRLSKRCGCKASISFKYFSDNGHAGYMVQDFNEVHNHDMVESEHKQFMSVNRHLDDVHQKFILDCSKANIGPTLTFKVLKETLGGFDLIGCTVGDIRNASRDIKAYAYGFDVQMVLDDMAKKKEMSKSYTYHYEVNEKNQLVALFWCDGLMKRNYHMFGDIVAFDTTYNTNRYCMIFTPFTGKDNHGRPVTLAAGLVCNEKIGAFGWLFRHFVECMGITPKMIVIDQDNGMRSAIEEVLVGTRHRWCMWHIMHKLATKVPNRLLRDEAFKKEFSACVWSDLLEPGEFEDGHFWIPAYFRDFSLGSMIRTTSISESENSFYKRILKPRANIAEFYLNFNHAVEFQRNSRTSLDYHDATVFPILATTLPFEKHASTLYTDTMFKRIQEEIVEGNDRCRVLGFSSTEFVDTYKLGDSNRKSQTVSKKDISMFYGFLRRFEGDIELLRAFVGGVEELGNSIQAGNPTTSASEKRRMIEKFYGMVRPEVVEVHPPDVVKTKGHASSSKSRLISKRENSLKDASRPLRRCKACDEMGHHDSRNYPMLKEMEMEKELGKGKRTL